MGPLRKTRRPLDPWSTTALVVMLATVQLTGCKQDEGNNDAGPAEATPAPPEEPLRDWVLIFYLPYDNDLDEAYEQVLAQLSGPIRSQAVAVAVQADRLGPGGSIRHGIDWTGMRSETIETESSARPATLGAFLRWAGDRYPSRRYAVILMGHGGRMDALAYDSHPGDGETSWMRVPEMARTVRKWRHSVAGEPELLFLQQCGKGSLENFFQLRHTAPILMSSQASIWAPNGYYAEVIAHLSSYPRSTGADVARQIGLSESDGMFVSYTTVRSSALTELPGALDDALTHLAAEDELRTPEGLSSCFASGTSTAFDFITWLEAVFLANERDSAPVHRLRDWIRTELVIDHHRSTCCEDRSGSWCGISTFPPLYETLDGYADYELYEQTMLRELYERLEPVAD